MEWWKRFCYIKWVIFHNHISPVKVRKLCNKIWLKNTTSVDRLKFAKKAEVPSLKTTVDKIEKVPRGLNSLKTKLNKLEVDKLATVPVDLKKLML